MTEISAAQLAAIREMGDKQAIEKALALHSRGVDRADFTLLSEAYHDDATVDYGFFVGPARDLARILADAQWGQPTSLHRTCSSWIKVLGNKAVSESYIVAYVETHGDEAAKQRLVFGRYLDRHEKRNGQWKLSHRTYVLDSNINQPGQMEWPEAAFVLGQYNPRGGQRAQDAGRAVLALAASGMDLPGRGGTPDTSANAIDMALSKQALHELGMAYRRGVDRADADLVRSVFHDDATVDLGFQGKGVDFAPFIAEQVSKNMDKCVHATANSWFEVDGDKAVGETYLISTYTAGGQDGLVIGRYLDRYERRQGVWKFAHRQFVQDGFILQPTTGQYGEGMYAALSTVGGHKPTDPVYAFWG